jgi:prepilin-type N-terminal cleavage/methylation domain-containing protein
MTAHVCPQAQTSHPRSRAGFTIVEMMVVIAVVGVVAAMGAAALSNMKSSLGRRAMTVDFYSELGVARMRARAKERTQIIVVDANAGTNGTFGYYHFEDAATPPAIFSGTQLANLVTAMTNPPTVPAGYTLLLLEQRSSATNGFYMNTDGWSGTPLPFPWAGLMDAGGKISTINGCSFCAAPGAGAIGFLPSGRAVFSDSNLRGGFIVIAGDTAGPSTKLLAGIGISPTGFVQQVER